MTQPYPMLKMGDHVLMFENTELGPEYVERALKEIRETPETVKAALEEFRELLKDEPNLKYPVEIDDKLKAFLRPCKYYPKSALERMKIFYRFKIKNPKYYENLIPSIEKRAFVQNLVTILPLRSRNGERLLLIQAGRKWDTKTCSLIEIVRSVMLLLEAALSEPRSQVSGVHVLIDVNGLSLTHVFQFTPGFAKTLVEWVQDCIPIRMKGIHIINQPYVFNMIYALFKPLLGEKLRNRILFHGANFKSLHKHVDPSALPLEYQGTMNIPDEIGQQLHDYLLSFETDFKNKSMYGYANEAACR